MLKRLIDMAAVSLAAVLLVSTLAVADVKVLVIPKGSKAIFWKHVGKGALQAGKDFGIGVTLRGPYTEVKADAQIKIIEFGIKGGFDAIVLAPNHVDRAAPALERAVAAGIKVVLIDSNMAFAHHNSFVESDNYAAGRMAADRVASILDGAGKVVLARHIANHASTHEREQGFLNTLKAQYPQIEVIAEPYAGSSVGSAYHTISDILDRFVTIDAIFSVSEEATVGILQVLKERTPQRKIKFVGFDFNTAIRDAILNHEMDATIAQNPFMIGYLGVKAAYQLTQNVPVPAKIYTDTILVTAEKYHTDEVQELLGSYLSPQD